ncbi:penicillin-binding transpeptidase domain-containing protein [Dyadobacter tibetensis]|uniref:penicillin-binding transpeptidase domain-containing protein n=1 Tax=Dyadobacter tibetensis TaxID=1211851 RepID=UPI0035B570DA
MMMSLFCSVLLNKVATAQDDLGRAFRDCQLKGSITIYDNDAAAWISSDIDDSHTPTLPASTFKIINTLIALETGVIADENEIVKWPGSTDTTKYGYRPDIYHDMSLREAFKLSAGWVYVELAKKIGKERYKQFLDACRYGNVDLSIDDPDFWNQGNFAISPVNQIKILKGVYDESLPFKKESFSILKNMMIEEQQEEYTLRAKTGWTRYGGVDTGWWVGYIEKKGKAFFFATRVIKDRAIKNTNFGSCRKEITKTILKRLNMLD